jgi:aspartyl-tRNA(Asn)/glutamyl-tRNA(Gln) amidotransferase subunit A
LEELDDLVAEQFEAAVARLGRTGVRVSEETFPLFDDMARVQSPATIATAEAWRIHGRQLAERGDDYDPQVRFRIELGGSVSDAAYARMIEERAALVKAMDACLADLDALILPTTPIVAPTMAEISSREGFRDANRLLLRNTAIANFFDLCAISLPLCGGALPVGLMLVARRGHDRHLFALAAAVGRANSV